MVANRVEQVRGVRDILPDEYRISKQIEDQLERCLESFGYRPIDVPIIEHTDLYLKKSGEEIISRLYDFVYQNRRLALRPEMTASVVRAFVANLQDAPLPIRLYFKGPVFRYEKPQRGRYRQFTQMGVELIGAGGPMADAEVISAACRGLDLLGLTDYRVVIGHMGILAEFLERLALENRLRSFLIANMEPLRKEGRQNVVDRLRDIYPAFRSPESEKNGDEAVSDDNQERKNVRKAGKMADLFRDMDDSEARDMILDLLQNMNIELTGTRDPDEIVDRLLAKIRREDQTPRISQALDFMSELGRLVGEPSMVLKEADKLLTTHGISHSPLDQLRAIIETLQYYDLDQDRISLDFGLSRGIQYYTGMIFEVYHGTTDTELQLCGGGRYDDLVATLGGRRDIPAVGFSYGIDRIGLALGSEEKRSGSPHRSVDVLVIPVSPDDRGYAVEVAEQLRYQRIRVEIDVRERSVTSNFQYAVKQGIPFVIVVGSEERAASEVMLKDLHLRKERRLTVSDAVDQISEMKEHHA